MRDYCDCLSLSHQSCLWSVLYIDCTLLIGACASDIVHRRIRIRQISFLSATIVIPAMLRNSMRHTAARAGSWLQSAAHLPYIHWIIYGPTIQLWTYLLELTYKIHIHSRLPCEAVQATMLSYNNTWHLAVIIVCTLVISSCHNINSCVSICEWQIRSHMHFASWFFFRTWCFSFHSHKTTHFYLHIGTNRNFLRTHRKVWIHMNVIQLIL